MKIIVAIALASSALGVFLVGFYRASNWWLFLFMGPWLVLGFLLEWSQR